MEVKNMDEFLIGKFGKKKSNIKTLSISNWSR